ncbi:sarcolemmal membrane-associated protein [Clupea harengus]|uniref:Sarcolemmal membrane-associated protein n=1 Tax=Clupea harengus TaxID=7950 RepID=A0A6P8H7L5_CLUHA|nr:sarcolemmal membrane-associated protein [Clupea harengus]
MEAVVDGSLLSSKSDGESPLKESSLYLDSNQQDSSLPSGQKQKDEEDDEEEAQGVRLLSAEEQVTLITDSMSVSSADEEKLQLLNKNMELRRINKELMKLNEDWDHIYRSTTLGLQQRVDALQREISSIRQLNSKLLLKMEHEQNKREYYEHTLMEELKKNQHLQEYVHLLEGRMQHTHSGTDCSILPQDSVNVSRPPGTTSNSTGSADQKRSSHHGNAHLTPPHPPSEHSSSGFAKGHGSTGRKQSEHILSEHTRSEVQDLKDQLEALKCQTKIYEADYRTEHKDHERMMQENKRLRRREGDMRQQMALLQEQLKVYEDDFQRERSDKQVLQRLLMKKTPPAGEPALVHRCSTSGQERERAHTHEHERERAREERRRKREEHRGLHHQTCPKHFECHTVGEFS